MGWVESALGEAVGELYVGKFFGGECKVRGATSSIPTWKILTCNPPSPRLQQQQERALGTVEAVRAELRRRLEGVEWMSPGTREKVIMIGEISPRYVAEGVERMSPSTRENILISAVISAKSGGDVPRRISRQALEKMRGFNVKIGYPDEWIDYGSLQVDVPYPAPP